MNRSTRSLAGLWVVSLVVAAAELFVSGCAFLKPKPVTPSDPTLDGTGEALKIRWKNNADYADVEVRITTPTGEDEVISDVPTKAGPVEASWAGWANAAAGIYSVRIITNMQRGNKDGEARSSPAKIEIDEPVIITREVLGRTGTEDLDVVFLIHPGCPFAPEKLQKPSSLDDEQHSVFRSVTDNVMRVIFPNPERLRSEDELLSMETQRDFLLERGQKPRRDPDALVLVDFRLPSEGSRIPGQLQMRILDLKLARKLGLAYDELFHRRALVVEGYRAVENMQPRVVRRKLIDAWRQLLSEVLDGTRYRHYRNAIAALGELLKDNETIDKKIEEADGERKGELQRAKDVLSLRFFGEVAPSMRRGDSEGEEERIASLAWGQLFSRKYAPTEAGGEPTEPPEEPTEPGEELEKPGPEADRPSENDGDTKPPGVSDDSEELESRSPPAPSETTETDAVGRDETIRKDDGDN